MDTIKKIYEGWAEEKIQGSKAIVFDLRAAYTAALEKLEPVAVAFAEWIDDEDYISDDAGLWYKIFKEEEDHQTTEQLFQYFINNIYNR